MAFNSLYGNLFKYSSNDSIFNLHSINKKSLPDFFVKLFSKSKNQKDKEKEKEKKINNNIKSYTNNNNNYYTNTKNNTSLNNNNINNNNINSNNNYNSTNNLSKIMNHFYNSNYFNYNNNSNLKKDDIYQRKKIEIKSKRKYSESSIINIRKNKIKKEDDYCYIDYFHDNENKIKKKKEKDIDKDKDKDNTDINNSNNPKNLKKYKSQFNNTNNNINNMNNTNNTNTNYNVSFFSPVNKKLAKFPHLSKLRKPLKLNDKQRYQKKFKENYAKLRNFLNHLYFMRKKYKFHNALSPNLILSNSKTGGYSNLKANNFREQLNELMLKFNNVNEIEEKNAVNLYIVNICSPIKNFQKDMLSLSRSVFCNKFNIDKKNNINHADLSHSFNHLQTNYKNNEIITPVRIKKNKNIKYNTISKRKEEKKIINNIKKYNKLKSIEIKTLVQNRNRNINHKLIKSKSNNIIKHTKQIKNRIKKCNILSKRINKANKDIKLYPLLRIDNFREQYQIEEEVEKFFEKKMFEIYFDLSKKMNLKLNNKFIIRETYFYKVNKMYYEQLPLYMMHRLNWELIEKNNDEDENSSEEQKTVINFEWKYYSNRLYYKKYKYNSSYPIKKLCVINLFEKNYEIGNKKKMFIHLINYCDKVNLNVFNYVPLTILINNTKVLGEELESFREIFNFVEYQRNKNENLLNNDKSIIINRKYNEQFWFESKFGTIKKQYIYINKNFLSHKNYWILKPTDLYQGKCIEISNSYDEIYKKCKNIFRGVDKRVKPELENDEIQDNNNNDYTYNNNNNNNNEMLTSSEDEQYEDNSDFRRKKKISNIYISNELIIQKYLDNPLLYRKRKFDIRCFVLVDWNLNVFFCREGHLKASSFMYDINNINKFIHITNHSFQKKSNKFEQFETGNEISYQEFKNFLIEEKIPLENFDKIINKMKFLVKLSFKAVGEKLIKTPNVLSFELFGYDFIIDNEYNPWILEINNNPGLSISSPVIEKIIPRMIDDAFRLTIDKIFNTEYSSDCFDNDGNYNSKFKLDGYNDNENVFEFLCNVKENID